MSVVVLLAPPALVLLVTPVLLAILASGARPDADLLPTTAAARRHAVLGGTAAVIAGAGTLLVVVLAPVPPTAATTLPSLGIAVRPLAALPGIAALAHTAVLAVVEATMPRPTGAVRRGRLRPRTVATTVPRRWRQATHIAAVALVVVVAVGALLADGSQEGIRTTVTAADGTVLATSSAGPFPGLVYGLPALVAGVLLLVAAEATLRLTVVRPAVVGADEVTDTALRRAAGHRVLRGALAGLLLTVGPLLAYGGMAGQRVVDGPLELLGIVTTIVGAILTLAGPAVLLVPAPRVPAPRAEPTGLRA